MSADLSALLAAVIRPDVRAQHAYHVPASAGFVKLDAMENPYTWPESLRAAFGERLARVDLNRYPVPSYTALRQAICAKLGVPAGYDVVLGNGSDELISMLTMACAQPGATVLAPVPAFVMYALSARNAGMRFEGVALTDDFSLDMPAMLAAIAQHRPAVLFLGYPNNPTGNLYPAAEIDALLAAMDGIGLVVVDEAYQPFAQQSYMGRLPDHPHLLVMRTVSKLGLAGIRLGYMSAHPALLAELDKVRSPYNINVLTEAAALFALEHVDVLDEQARLLREERTALAQALSALPGVTVFPSAANFLLLRVADSDAVFGKLLARRILVKNLGKMHARLAGCLRVTVSTPQENAQFTEALRAALSL
jgi:histidinol-phosphate aminotransferase